MTDEEWEAFYKVHTGAKSLRITLLPFRELCATLYDNSCATGSMRRSLAPRRPSSSSIDFETPTIHTENVHNQSEDDDNTTNQGLEGVSSTPPRARSPDVDQGRRNKKVKKTVDLSELEVDMRKAIANLAKDKNTGITIDDCHDKLKGLELETTDPMYLAAFGIFSQASNNFREAWMALPSNLEVLKRLDYYDGEDVGSYVVASRF